MLQHLLQEAKELGVSDIAVALVVKHGEEILLVENLQAESSLYEIPRSVLLDKESLSQAVVRTLVDLTNLGIKNIERFLTYFDEGKKRTFAFIVEAQDLQDIFLRYHKAYSWLLPEEAMGYPLDKISREAIRLVLKLKEK